MIHIRFLLAVALSASAVPENIVHAQDSDFAAAADSSNAKGDAGQLAEGLFRELEEPRREGGFSAPPSPEEFEPNRQMLDTDRLAPVLEVGPGSDLCCVQGRLACCQVTE